MTSIQVRGACDHNLQHVDLDLPHGAWIAVVGPSGSGKTSLVFDTIVQESRRRFLGAVSTRARLFLGKLGRADVSALTGLPPAIAVGHRSVAAHARSTVGTRTGLLDLLRLLFARVGHDPCGTVLTRSHFSFNHPDGQCPSCKGSGEQDHVDPALLVADPSKSIRAGALRPTLKNGYTVYSQVTVDVMDQICRAHGFTVDTPWLELTADQHKVVFFGTKALTVPFGKHSLESRMKWEGIVARPREEGHYRGIVPVIQDTLKRGRNPNILRYVRSVPCETCRGTRLARPGREATIGAHTLPGLLELPAETLAETLVTLPPSAVWDALAASVMGRLDRMRQLGLSHLSLSRRSGTLSAGEAQRVALVAQLATELGGMVVAVDEPTLGLHPADQPGLSAVLGALRDLGNTLLVVEHDPDLVRCADHLVALGPGAGPTGGTVVYSGETLRGPGGAEPLGPPPVPVTHPREGSGELALSGASLHNLDQASLTVRLGAFNVVTGPSGAGKSSLVFGCLVPALQGELHATSMQLSGVPPGLQCVPIDARPIGRTPRSTPATYTGAFDLIRKRFAHTDAARAAKLTASRFSFNSRAGRCADCEGLGVKKLGLHLLADAEVQCGSCGGKRYSPEVLAVTLRGHSIADVLEMDVSAASQFFAEDDALMSILAPMEALGLGHVKLGQSSTTLSRGEAQRIKLATCLAKPGRTPTLVVMDEPDRGLHPSGVMRLLRAVDALVAAGHTVLAISHHRHLWAAADHRVAMRAGKVLAEPPRWRPQVPAVPSKRALAVLPQHIELSGVRTHNLQDVSVRIPHRALTVVVGPSGSGKSALAFDTLAAEGWARFSESLPFAVRRHLQSLPRPPIDGARGLTPTLALSQRASRAGARSTVATQSGLGPLLRLLFARAGRLNGAPCGLRAEHFSPDQALGACPCCAGRGTVPRAVPARLITHPDRSLRGGALDGTKPGRFLGEPDGQTLATLAAVLSPGAVERPWSDLSVEDQAIALHGAGDRVVSVTWHYRRGKRTGTHTFEGTWDGLMGRVEHEARLRARRKDAAEWGALLEDTVCGECGGTRLQPTARAVLLDGHSLPALLDTPLHRWPLAIAAQSGPPAEAAVVQAIWPDVCARIGELSALGLGHLTLSRSTATLSDGELQRVRLAAVCRAGLTHTTVVLDEPTAGLHAGDVAPLLGRLQELRDAGNTVVVVDHRPSIIRAADHLIELGPGAAEAGGQVVAAGAPADVLAGETATARALRDRRVWSSEPARWVARGLGVRVLGASLHNLQHVDLSLPAAGVVAVTGPSGSGKSSLVSGVLGASAVAGHPVGCVEVAGLERFVHVRSSGTRAQTPLDALGLMRPLQALFHKVGGHGLPRSAFSFRSKAGRCGACKGTGSHTVSMDALADLSLPCPECGGARYRPEVRQVLWRGWSIDGLLGCPVSKLDPSLPVGALKSGVNALVQAGLGHLSLGRTTRSLSGGERQRLGLAAAVVGALEPTLHIIEEPGRGLHESDIPRIAALLQHLGSQGHLVVATVHRASLLPAADLVVELGPGAGAAGGRVVSLSVPASSGSA